MAVGSKQYQDRLRWTRISLGIVIVLCLALAHSVWGRIQIEREMAARREAVEASHQELQARYDALADDVRRLRDDASAEAELRKYFDVAGVGEQVVIILDDEGDEASPILPVTAPTSTSVKWWQRIF